MKFVLLISRLIKYLYLLIYLCPLVSHLLISHQPQAFLDLRIFDFRDFLFNAVYNSILFSSPLVLLT